MTLEEAVAELASSIDEATVTRVIERSATAPASEVEHVLARHGSLRTTLAPWWAEHIAARERARARAMLDDGDVGATFRNESFEARVYQRVADMFDTVDFEGARRLDMIGSGPLPATLMHVADRAPHVELHGIDVSEAAVSLAGELCSAAETRARFHHGHGQTWDFGGADIVYVANLCAPKAAILERVVRTRREGARVVLRDPHGLGALFAERGVDVLPEGLRVVGLGPADPGFLSRHVFLE